jgi:hypothetical protein
MLLLNPPLLPAQLLSFPYQLVLPMPSLGVSKLCFGLPSFAVTPTRYILRTAHGIGRQQQQRKSQVQGGLV